MEMKKIWFNGKLIPWRKAEVHVLSHALHYGSGVFEGIRCYKAGTKSAIFQLHEHIKRLFYSANLLKMPMQYTEKEIANAIIETIKANGLKECYIRPIAFYGYKKMSVNPIGNPIELAIACWRWDAYLSRSSVDVKTSSYTRTHPNSTEIEAKICGSYVNSILASVELHGTHYHEALFLDNDGNISEGAGENIFFVKNGSLYTPKLGTILPGITREVIIKIAQNLQISVIEGDLTLRDAYDADEAFFTGTAVEVTPIRSIDDKIIGQSESSSMTALLRKKFFETVRGANKELVHHLTFF